MSMLFAAADKAFSGPQGMFSELALPAVNNAPVDEWAAAINQYMSQLSQIQAPANNGPVEPAPAGSTSARNLANFNFGNVKTASGDWARYASREDGLMGIGERVMRYHNAPDRGWHANTIRDVINIYAPASDGNDVNGYANFVARRMGVSPTAKLDFNDPTVLAGFIEAMPLMEHGAKRVNISRAEALSAAQKLLQGQRPTILNATQRAQNIVQQWGYRK